MQVFKIARVIERPWGVTAQQNIRKPDWRPSGPTLKCEVDLVSTHGMTATLYHGEDNILGRPDTEALLLDVLKERAIEQITLADDFMKRASAVLIASKQYELRETVTRLYPMVLPHLILGSHGNPVHHSAKVLEIAAEISRGEDLTPGESRILCTAALLHDAGLARTNDKKIRTADIEAIPDPVEKGRARLAAIQSRKSHMLLGASLAWELLGEFNALPENSHLQFSMLDIRRIQEIIRRHDDPTIEDLSGTKSGEWLFLPEEKLLMLHREADRLWMVTPEGLDADLAKDKVKDPQARFLGNIQRHEEEAASYFDAFGAEADRYGFYTGLHHLRFGQLPENVKLTGRVLYSSISGFAQFNQYIEETAKGKGISIEHLDRV